MNRINHTDIVFCAGLALCLAVAAPGACQPLSSDTWLARNHQWLLDLGVGWETQTLFRPDASAALLNYYRRARHEPSYWPAEREVEFWKGLDRIKTGNPEEITGWSWLGTLDRGTSTEPDSLKRDVWSVYWIAQMEYRNWYAEWYLRAASHENRLDHFTGRSRSISRLGLNCAEFDQASVGYRNEWMSLSYGRGRQSWGPFGRENPVLSDQSAAYDHLSTRFAYKRVTAAFFTGFLESVPDGGVLQNRYIAGRGIEYSNRRNFVMALGEATVYSGPNRKFDLAYLNPLPIHLETELNDRENLPYSVSNRSNAVWFAAADWLMPGRVRCSATFLVDEFQFDRKDRNEGRPDATAAAIRIARGVLRRKSSLTAWALYQRVGTYTFRHESDFTGFVSRGLPLGTPIGSDSDDWRIGINAVLPPGFEVQTYVGSLRQGQNTLLDSLYTGYSRFVTVDFPSGNVKKTQVLALKLLYSFHRYIEAEISIERRRLMNENRPIQTLAEIRFNAMLPLSFKL
jgi:hypothetical protein